MKSAEQIQIELAMQKGAEPVEEGGDVVVHKLTVPRERAEAHVSHLEARLNAKVETLHSLGLDSGRLYDEAVQIQAEIDLFKHALEFGSVVEEIEP